MRVLGVDPGTSVTGYGVIEAGNGSSGMGRLVECGVIRLAGRSPLPRRLHALHEQIAAAQAGLTIAEYAPATIKKTVVGAGGAPKAQVGRMVARLLRLKDAPRPADAADGVAVALTHILRS